MPKTPDTRNCMWVYWNFCASSSSVRPKPLVVVAQLTNHMVAMKPTVPNTRIGGKSLTVSIPCVLSKVKAVVFDSANVGI